MPGPVPHLAMSSAKPESSLEPDAGGGGGGRSELGGLDAQLWHACAGGMVQLPRVGSKVVYFPQGHAEQAASAPEFPRSLGPLGSVPCRVVSVNFLADAETDEVFSRICLQPEPPGSSSLAATQSMDDAAAAPASPPPAKPAAFSKTLTQSDANNGGGFSVPRYCAETIFPPLDYATDPPVQTVLAKDVHGDVWKFRHIYRGTPRRHLLTTGWSTFVNQKKLVAGDAIVFLRIASGELCVGVRRSMRGGGASSGVGESSSWHSSSVRSSPLSDFLGGPEHGYGLSTRSENHNNNNQSSGSPTCSFARDRVRVTAKSVLEAAQLAITGKPFEVVYYPRASTAEFCVEAGLVKSALDHSWYAGMRFKMAFETEDSSRISWFMGTIAAVQPIDPVMWPNSPWRVLQVAWDEPDLLPGVSRVSPWQVRLLATLPMQLPPFALPKKKPRLLPEVLPGGLPLSPSPWRTTTSTSTTTTNSWALTVQDDSSAGMQGARHDHFNGLQPEFRSSSNFKRPRESSDEEEQVLPPTPPPPPPHNYFALLPPPSSRHPQPPDVPVPVPSSMQAQQGFMSEPKKNATSFFLFGQFIDPSCASSKSQQQRPNNLLDKDKEKASDMIKWLQANEQGGSMRRSPHFEVFMEGDAVGRTLELSWFNTYEELYSRLAAMFSVSMSQLQDCVVYRDVRGSVRRIGDEPFRSFVEIGRHLTILQHRANRAIEERSY